MGIKINELKKDIQLKCPELTDDVLQLLTEYLIGQISNKLRDHARMIGMSFVVSDGECYSSMCQRKDGVNFFIN